MKKEFGEFIKEYAIQVNNGNAKPLTMKQYNFAQLIFENEDILEKMSEICDLTYIFNKIEFFVKHCK